MSNAPANIRQADVARVVRAAKAAGAPSVEVRLPGATVVINLDKPQEPAFHSFEQPQPRKPIKLI